jgi:tetratricopeptide (TPR) repeat protein
MKKIKVKKKKPKKVVFRVDPKVDSRVDEAVHLADRGYFKQAESILTDLLVSNDDILSVHFGMGVVMMVQKRFDTAIMYFSRAVKIYPYYWNAWYNLATCYHKTDQFALMIKAYRQVIEWGNPEEEHVQHAKKVIELLRGSITKEFGLTLERYLQASDIFEKAVVAMDNSAWDIARKGFETVLKINPKSAKSYGNLGICYIFLKRYEDALKALDNALLINPNYELAKNNRTSILEAMNADAPKEEMEQQLKSLGKIIWDP